jgi:hypothetical protein
LTGPVLSELSGVLNAAPARAARAAGRACRAAWWRVAWAAVLTVAMVVMLAGAVWLAAFVAVPGW